MILIIMLLYIAAIYFSVFKPTYFVILFGVLGNVYDGYGIGAYINEITRIHYPFFYVLLYVSLISSFVYYYKSKTQKYNHIIALYAIFSVSIVASIFGYSLTDINGSQSVVSIVMDSLYKAADFSFVVGAILLFNHKKHNVIKMLKYYVVIQITIAVLVIYLPNIGINALENINGLNHQDILVYSAPFGATLNNFFEVFSNKYYFNKFAHFHNSNDTGFFFGTALLLTIIQMENSNKKGRYLILCIFLFVLWTNSGMRAPLVAIIFSIIAYNLVSRISIKRIILTMLLLSIVIVPFLFSSYFELMLNFITGANSTATNPFEGRMSFIFQSLVFLKDKYLIGYGTDLIRLSSNGITPHFLPLRIATMSGVFAGILSIICVYIHPILLMIRQNKISLFSIGVYSLLVFVSVTNNYTNIVLFNFLLASLVANLKPLING